MLFDMIDDVFEALTHPFTIGFLVGGIYVNIIWVAAKYFF